MKAYVLWLRIKILLIAVGLAILLMFRKDILGYIEVGAYVVLCCVWLLFSLTKLILFACAPRGGYIINIVTSCVLCVFVLGWCAMSFVFVPFAPILLIPLVMIGGGVVAYNALLIRFCLNQILKQ